MSATRAQIEYGIRCDRCPTYAAWSIQNLEGPGMQPIVRWFACGRHLHRVRTDTQIDWEVDAIQLMDLRPEPEGGF